LDVPFADPLPFSSSLEFFANHLYGLVFFEKVCPSLPVPVRDTHDVRDDTQASLAKLFGAQD
jgi:hypothetical protein